MIKISPLRDQLVVIVNERQTQTAGGIQLVERAGSSSTLPSSGKVIAVGPGATDKNGITQPMDIEVGHTVLFHKSSGIKLPGESISDFTDYRIMRHEDVLAVLVDS
jgi:chaperonin GroES